MKCSALPGAHFSVLHVTSSVLCPWHGGLIGPWFTHCRCRSRAPPPQDAEHVDHSLHSDQAASSGVDAKMIKIHLGYTVYILARMLLNKN